MLRPDAIEGEGQNQGNPRAYSRRGFFRLLRSNRKDEPINTSVTDITPIIDDKPNESVLWSRRRFVTTLAGIAGGVILDRTIFNGRLINTALAQVVEFLQPKKIETAEWVTTANYSVVDLRETVGLVNLTSDNSRRVVVVDYDESLGGFALKEVGRAGFYALAVSRSTTDPNIIAAVGDREVRAGQGRFSITKNGGQSWQTIEHPGGNIFDVQITPDNKYAIVIEADNFFENTPVYYKVDLNRLDLGAGAFTRLESASGGPLAYAETAVKSTSTPNVYKAYGKKPLTWGYDEITFNADNTVTVNHLNPDEGYGRGRIVHNVDNQHRDRVWLFNADTDSPDNPNGRTGTLFDNINNSPVAVQPKVAFAPQPGSIDVMAGDMDVVSNTGVMAVVLQDYDNNQHRYLEAFPLDAQTDLTRRVKINLPGGTARGDPYSSLYVLNWGSNRYWEVGLKASLNPADDGVWLSRINNPDGVWTKLSVASRIYKVFVPVIMKNNFGN